MLKSYPKFKRGEIEKVYKNLSKAEKKILEDYLNYRRARGITSEPKLKDTRRFILQFRKIIEKDFNKFDLEDFRKYFALVASSHLKDTSKIELRVNIKNFLKYLFKDWSLRFNDFDGLKSGTPQKNEERINSQNMFKHEDIEKCIKAETKLYWKAFLLTQFEGGLRTKEVRCLKWDDVKFNVDGDLSEIKIYATKTKKARTIFIEKATFYLKQLEQEQENTKDKGVYIFHSKKDINKPVDRGTISMWFRRLTKKALGEERWNYLLRHSRATELYKLAKEGKISKDTAITFMGHSEDMSKTYTHLDTDEIKEMLKNQIYKIEDLPPEKKDEYEKRIEELEKVVALLKKRYIPPADDVERNWSKLRQAKKS